MSADDPLLKAMAEVMLDVWQDQEGNDDEVSVARITARAVLAAIQATGRLLGPDARSFRQYAIQVPGEKSVRAISLIRTITENRRDELSQQHEGAYVVTRLHTEHDEPWEAAS